MAKLKKVKEVEYYKNSEGQTVKVFPSFVYEVEVFVMVPRMYYLADTLNVSLKENKKEGSYYSKKGESTIRQVYTLLAAPKPWLEENKYKPV